MKPSPNARDLIKKFEGLRTKPYMLNGKLNIGYGHTQDVQPTDTITPQQAEGYLDSHLMDASRQLNRYLKREPTQMQYDAMLSLVYNMGIGAFSRSDVLSRFNAGDDPGAGEAFLKYDNSYAPDGTRVRYPGLTRRRQAERDLFLVSPGVPEPPSEMWSMPAIRTKDGYFS